MEPSVNRPSFEEIQIPVPFGFVSGKYQSHIINYYWDLGDKSMYGVVLLEPFFTDATESYYSYITHLLKR